MRTKPPISLIIPCYNEETNIQKGVLDKIGNYTRNSQFFKEVLIVDDGSTDDTKKLIKKEYLSVFPKFKLIENPHQGKAFTLMKGIKKAKGEYVMFTDIDLATPIEEAEKLIKRINKKSKIIIGSRNTERKNAPLLRKVMAVGFIILRNIIIGLHGIKDTQCGFKIFRKEEALEIIHRLQIFKEGKQIKNSSVSAGFDLEFLYLAKKLHFKIVEVPVSWQHVETKNVNFIRDSWETLRDIFKIKIFELEGKYTLKVS